MEAIAQPVPQMPQAPLGEWKSARITDVGRPIGKQFMLRERVYYRDGDMVRGIAAVHLLVLRANGGTRRWLSRTQLRGATNDWTADVGVKEQASLSNLWNSLDPKPAGFHPGTQIPLRYKSLDVRLVEKNPEVNGICWQGDTTPGPKGVPPNMEILVERAVMVNPPVKPSAEQDQRDIADLLEHELVELVLKGQIVDERWPYISDADRQRCMDEMEGPGHVLTIGQVEEFYGEDAERRYLAENDYPFLRRRGFGKQVDAMIKTDL